MLYIELRNNKAVAVHESSKVGYISRWDYESMDHVAKLAAELTEATGELYIPVTTGASPKWDVIKAPKVGDDVSYGFNGDYYPSGKITSISPTMKLITTEGGRRYYRKGTSGAWVMGGTWTLVQGVHFQQNPSF